MSTRSSEPTVRASRRCCGPSSACTGRPPHLQPASRAARGGRHRAARRAGCEPGVARGVAHPLPARGHHHARKFAARAAPGTDRGRLLRHRRAGRAGRAGGGAGMSWVNAIVQGVLIGGLYALFACGLSLMFGVMKVINLAHGDLAVVAAYVGLGVIAVTGVPAVWSFVLVVPIMAVVGYVMQRTLLQAALNRSVLTTLLV